MTHTYQVTGITCGSCEAKVKDALMQVNGITGIQIDRAKGDMAVTMQRHVETSVLQQALSKYPSYQLREKAVQMPLYEEEQKSGLQTYKPILLIFAFITGTTLLVQWKSGSWNGMEWMTHFMGGFFLVFSFFKLLNLQGFADSYSTYDIIAKRWRPYAYLYAFAEMVLGGAYVAGIAPLWTNGITFMVMGISLTGVLQSLLDKRKIRCACLGDVFNLPMSTITVLEDALMMLMSLYMFLEILF